MVEKIAKEEKELANEIHHKGKLTKKYMDS
jgi:hypothetical protein